MKKTHILKGTILSILSIIWLYYMHTFVILVIMGLAVLWTSLIPTTYKKTKFVILTCLTVLVLCGLLFVLPAVLLEQRGKRIATYEVGRELALYCQTLKREMQDGLIGTAWLPRAVAEIEPFWVRMDDTNVYVALGGGFFPLGASLELNEEASNSTESVWEYTYGLADEHVDRRHVATIKLKRSESIPEEIFIQNAISGYDRQISKNPKAIEAYKEKIMFLLLFDCENAAIETCKQAAEVLPDHWFPQLLMAFIMTAKPGNEESAANQLELWTAKHATFPNYSYLAYYYQLEGREEKAISAIEKAITLPLTDGEYNEYFYARWMAYYALEHNGVNLALKICDLVHKREMQPARSRYDKNYLADDFAILRTVAEANNPDTLKQKIEYIDLNPFKPHFTNATQEIKIGRHIFFRNEQDNENGG